MTQVFDDDHEEMLPELDDRLERYIEGSLSAEERAALEAEAVEDPLLAVALEAAAPLPDAVVEKATQAAVEQFHAGRRPSWSSLPSWAAPAVAMAAALMIAVLAWPESELPTYDQPRLVRSAETRSEGAAPAATFGPGDGLELQLPAFGSEPAAPQLLVYLDAWSPEARLEVSPTAIAPNGSIRVVGTMGDPPWDLPKGKHRLLIAVGPEGAWAPSLGGPGPRWQRFELPLVVE